MNPIFEQYDENNFEHQNPIHPISSWQEYNDVTGAESIMIEESLAFQEEMDAIRIKGYYCPDLTEFM